MKKGIFILWLLISIAVLSAGCATTPVQRGAVGGGAAGAAAGQLIGKNTKSTMIGAGVGALGGALFNDTMKVERR